MENQAYWDRCWNSEDARTLFEILLGYNHLELPEMALFRENHIHTVCDAACGFGAYTLAFASQGFAVKSFDISPKAAQLTREGLHLFGYDNIKINTASLLDTGYEDGAFDAVLAQAVLDHMTCEDTKKALSELVRITRAGGFLSLSFDTAEEDDYCSEHILLPDGSMLYTGTSPRANRVLKSRDFRKNNWQTISNVFFWRVFFKNSPDFLLKTSFEFFLKMYYTY